ncbi:hypothetical protein ABZ890_08410 [Streptomyces sp. NPDC046984]|uniref:hypothetical protein n=1 Tax=Streptomyces sp. NPDC046984 TaxID=3155138 RepID=UPI0033EC8186
MMRTGITWRFTVQVRGATSSDEAAQILDEHIDQVMDELLNLADCRGDVHDPSVGAELATGTVEIELTVDGKGSAALDVAESVVRAAIHAAGGFTPSWGDAPGDEAMADYKPLGAELAYA